MNSGKVRAAFVVPAIALCLIVFPIVYSYSYLGTRLIFNFLAADSMYYLEVANNFTKFGFPTSDGLTTTNGFQPLWEMVLIIIFKAFHVTHDRQLFVIFYLSVLCVSTPYVIIAFTFSQLFGLLSGLIATLTLFPGFYSVIFEPRSHYESEGGIQYTLKSVERDKWC